MSKPNIIKVVLLGSSGVGKSSILYRYVTNGWDDNNQATLGAAFMDKQVTYKKRSFKFQIWDTAGQEKYAPLAQMYYRDANVAIMVFDVTSAESFNNLKSWQTELIEKGPKNMILAVVGNKCDLVDQAVISTDEGEAFAKSCNAIFMKTSAKENMNVTELFDKICDELINKLNIQETAPESKGKKLKPTNEPKTTKPCCG